VLVDPTQEEFIDWNQARDPSQKGRQDDEWKDIAASLAEAHESRVPPGIPVVLITAMGPLPSFVTGKQKTELNIIRPMWLKFHDDWVEKIPNARHIITKNSGHDIPLKEPELIIRTIRKMVEKTRGGK